jgi:hypothetical protein
VLAVRGDEIFIFPDENVDRVAQMAYAVARDRTILEVEDLVDRYGVNKRALQRLFTSTSA